MCCGLSRQIKRPNNRQHFTRHHLDLVLFIAILLVLHMGCAVFQANSDGNSLSPTAVTTASASWKQRQFQDIEKLYAKYPHDFLGLAVASDNDKKQAYETACVLALSDLTKSIESNVYAVIKKFDHEIYLRGRWFTTEDFDALLQEISDVRIRNVKYETRDSLLDEAEHYHVSVLALKNRQAFFDDYINLIHDEDKNKLTILIDHIRKKIVAE